MVTNKVIQSHFFKFNCRDLHFIIIFSVWARGQFLRMAFNSTCLPVNKYRIELLAISTLQIQGTVQDNDSLTGLWKTDTYFDLTCTEWTVMPVWLKFSKYNCYMCLRKTPSVPVFRIREELRDMFLKNWGRGDYTEESGWSVLWKCNYLSLWSNS